VKFIGYLATREDYYYNTLQRRNGKNGDASPAIVQGCGAQASAATSALPLCHIMYGLSTVGFYIHPRDISQDDVKDQNVLAYFLAALGPNHAAITALEGKVEAVRTAMTASVKLMMQVG
jgi:hypothetical protein